MKDSGMNLDRGAGAADVKPVSPAGAAGAEMGATRWRCEKCRKRGFLLHDRHADFWSVFQKLIKAHYVASPRCEFDEMKVRVQLVDKPAGLTASMKLATSASAEVHPPKEEVSRL